jgi:prevent-host-death family protein
MDMATVSLKDAKAGFSNLVDEAIKGEFITITRHGKPVATLVSIAAAEAAQKALGKGRPSLVAHLRTFPGDGDEFDRNPSSSRDVDL